MAFPYKKVLVVGATSGIGLAIAERLVQQGIFVIGVGRRKENLDAFVQSQGSDKAAAVQFDITKLDAIPGFVQDTTSGLALVPILRCSNYCASKAALHHWILCLREQLKGSNIKVIEILPPAVQTELHDAKHQPDIVDGRNFGMPLDEFTNETMEKLLLGEEQIPIGMAKNAFESFEKQRQEIFTKLVETMKQKR
ncbi:hypothetical protein T310_1523 [Rasamsonia emersonii CBS 393.64]|uniref:Uncharacterized protein n=1 Tax=Rasamsonia emersonii (strain ATCC 16479 / CBS 393.64 / IMI 116815) TaxID=1408163 RepID=A0A0F4Z1V9_RASE3|nr:hypothetical protein T310_1523 [Rasamsonia emersonii CBS 393.64]KKA24494.1 hypothetical protein T310_1523 [Rasamsonia emersonii CBS 393.64]